MKARRVSVVVDLLVVVGLIVLGGVVLPASGQSGGVAQAAAPEGTAYKIGFFASITGSGSSLGLPQRDTVEMLQKQLADGVTGADGVHHALDFVIYDDESNPDTAASVARRLITQDEVDVIVGGTLSGNAAAVVPLATESEIPFVAMASARSVIEDPNTGQTRPWIFKTAQENPHSAEWQALYLKAKGITTVVRSVREQRLRAGLPGADDHSAEGGGDRSRAFGRLRADRHRVPAVGQRAGERLPGDCGGRHSTGCVDGDCGCPRDAA